MKRSILMVITGLLATGVAADPLANVGQEQQLVEMNQSQSRIIARGIEQQLDAVMEGSVRALPVRNAGKDKAGLSSRNVLEADAEIPGLTAYELRLQARSE